MLNLIIMTLLLNNSKKFEFNLICTHMFISAKFSQKKKHQKQTFCVCHSWLFINFWILFWTFSSLSLSLFYFLCWPLIILLSFQKKKLQHILLFNLSSWSLWRQKFSSCSFITHVVAMKLWHTHFMLYKLSHSLASELKLLLSRWN